MSVLRINTTNSHRLEYNATKQRIDQALETLKRELKTMREEDVALLKQLIKINETIKKLARGRTAGRPFQSRGISAVPHLPNVVDSGKARLVRQMSEPHDCRINHREDDFIGTSIGSLEDALGTADDFSFSSGSELEDSTSSLREIKMAARPIARPRSISFMASSVKQDLDSPTGNNSVYEEILRRNIVLWRHRVNSETKNDSVFCEEDEEDDYTDNSIILV